MKNKAAVYKLILILICAVVALLPVAVSVDAKANETISRAGASPSSEDEEDVSESLSGTLLTSLAVTDPEETEIFPTWSTEVLTDPVESESVCETSTETSFDAETSFPSSVLSSSSQSETENLIGILGDSNTDGRVNIRDATQIRKFAAKLCNLSSDSEKCADVNSDSLVNIKDATLIQKYSANLETGVPMGMPVLV